MDNPCIGYELKKFKKDNKPVKFDICADAFGVEPFGEVDTDKKYGSVTIVTDEATWEVDKAKSKKKAKEHDRIDVTARVAGRDSPHKIRPRHPLGPGDIEITVTNRTGEVTTVQTSVEYVAP